MASQQVQTSSQGRAVQAHHLQRIDTSGRPLPPNLRDAARTRPQLLNHQEIDAINKKLLAACQTIEATRQSLYETRFIADTTLRELEQEQHIRQQCSDAYKEAHVQYGKKVDEVHEMTTKCMSLHNELDESHRVIANYESAFERYEKSIASGKEQLENTTKDAEKRTSEIQKRIQELENEVNDAVARECLATGRICELEKEVKDLNLVWQRADRLEEEKGQLALALRKIHDLEKEKEDTAQQHRAKINQMIACGALAEQKIVEQQQEITELIQDLQAATTITIDGQEFAEGKPGTKRPAYPARGRPTKHRKCKDAKKVEDEEIEACS